MPNIFEVEDPRGRRVNCSEDCWDKHIVVDHYIMSDKLDEVVKVIERPHFIATDSLFNDREVYYRRRRKKLQYIKVVVEFDGASGNVRTAYITDSGKSGERVIWMPSKE